jgi:hypothetical protein
MKRLKIKDMVKRGRFKSLNGNTTLCKKLFQELECSVILIWQTKCSPNPNGQFSIGIFISLICTICMGARIITPR